MKKQTKRKSGRITVLVLAAAVLAVAGGIFMMSRSRSAGEQGLLDQLADLSADRSITAEEYDFFAGLAQKQGRENDEAGVKQLIGEINAEFYLASRMELCDPFDYESFRYRTEAENKDREMKRITGQLYYGPDSYSEESYFEYLHSRLRSDMLSWLVAHRDRAMVDAAHDFFDRNADRFRAITSVTYEVTQPDGSSETKTLEDTMFKTMGQSDPALMDFLEAAEDGEEKLLTDGSERLVRRIGITTELTPFEEQEPYVVEIWLLQEVLDPLIAAIAQNTVLVF